MSSSYRRDRYVRANHHVVEGWYKLGLLLLLFMVTGVIAFFQWSKSVKLESELEVSQIKIKQHNEELSILRTLNPYHVGSNEVLKQAVAKADLFPGWIARVYPIPKSVKEAPYMQDVGSFVLHETRFSLSSHKSYGITQPSKSMYRMNGLFPNHKKGRLQVGVEFYLTKSAGNNEKGKISKICSCYARVDVNQKRVIDSRLHLISRFESDQVLTGDVELNKGLFPISAMFYCDEKSDFNGDEVEVSISFRNSEQYNLTTSRYSVFHIYNPENITANL